MTKYASYSDERLLDLLKKSDETAFTEIYSRYWQKLIFIAHKRLHSADDAKEIVQNVFFKLWQKKQTLDIRSLPLYLSAMVRYAIYRFWANNERKRGNLSVVSEEFHEPEPAIENKQLLELLTNFAETLPDKYRIVFISHKILDQPLEEVAEQLGVSPRTAERYVSKVLEIMRNRLDKIALSTTLSIFL